MDTPIFGLRFKSNELLQPDSADLAAFLRAPRAPGAHDTHRDIFAGFSRYLELVEQGETGVYSGLGRQDFGERMLLGVLSHTRFFRPALRIAIEEYLYHHHRLRQLDFNKPEKFIRSAEEELAKLNPKKRDDQQKAARLQAMLDQRKADLVALVKQRRMLTGELGHITVYVRDNIARVQELCEGSIAGLAKLQVGGKKTEQLVEDIKEYFKGEVRERRQMGAVTPDYLDTVKAEVAELSQALKQQVLGDIYAVTGLYEGLYEHAKKHAAELGGLVTRAEQARKNDAVRDDRPFVEIELVLVGLVSEFRPAVTAADRAGNGERHEDLLREKRREMLDHVFALLKEQRRGDAWTV